MRIRYAAVGGPASTASLRRNRSTSAAKAVAESYLRERSFSRDFITIQSNSPRTNVLNFFGSICRLAATEESKPDVTLFNWPIHNNRQLDLGEEAARAAVTGFVGRKLEQQLCSALILLGRPSGERVAAAQLEGIPVVNTVSSAQMLADPVLKKQAWADLLPIVRRP